MQPKDDVSGKTQKRVLSPEGRAAIQEGQRKRWAATAPGARSEAARHAGLSQRPATKATRRKRSDAARARWAKVEPQTETVGEWAQRLAEHNHPTPGTTMVDGVSIRPVWIDDGAPDPLPPILPDPRDTLAREHAEGRITTRDYLSSLAKLCETKHDT